MQSIFDTVVAKENEHSNLLRNIFERYPKATSAVLGSLLSHTFGEHEAALLSIRTQVFFLNETARGIPDVVLNGANFRCIIEVKVDPSLDLTDEQKGGYRACFEAKDQCLLIFLVPNEWKYCRSAQDAIDSVSGLALGKILFWGDLIRLVEDAAKDSTDEILGEVIRFWRGRFQSEIMTKSEKIALESVSEDVYSAISKLERTVLQAKSYFSNRRDDFITELETGDKEYGFYLKRGGEYYLWIGIWPKLSSPLSLGFPADRRGGWKYPSDFPATYQEQEKYKIWQLSMDCWDDPEKLYVEATRFIDSLKYV